jgi:hypothetical protein
VCGLEAVGRILGEARTDHAIERGRRERLAGRDGSGSFSRMAVNTLSCDLPSKARRLVTISSLKGQLESVDELAAKHLPERREWEKEARVRLKQRQLFPRVQMLARFMASSTLRFGCSPTHRRMRNSG